MTYVTKIKDFFRCTSGAVGGEWIGISAILFAVGLGLAVTAHGLHGGQAHSSSISFAKPASSFSISGVLETFGLDSVRTVSR